jgi:hypothetical protein
MFGFNKAPKKTGPELLLEATQLKKENKISEACEKLKEAYSANGYLNGYGPSDAKDEPSITDRLRFPMYLQIAGNSASGWKELNRLNKKYTGVLEQPHISKQMRIFLNKEKKHSLAVVYAAWSICTYLQQDKFYIDKLNNDIKQQKRHKMESATTKRMLSTFSERVAFNVTQSGVKTKLKASLKKAGLLNDLDRVSLTLSNYLQSTEDYDFKKVSVIASSKTE